MNVSFDWIKTWLSLPQSAGSDVQTIADVLTATGLEVEGVEEIPAVPGGLKGMVVGEVLTCGPHPNADRLRVTTVDVGTGEPLSIVCGAPNVAAGQKVIVATVGATCHPSEGEPFKIKKGKIRGEVSEGMICAEDELGIGNDHDGILVLEEPLQAGSPAADALGVASDHQIEIGLTPNRTDAMGHIGVAGTCGRLCFGMAVPVPETTFLNSPPCLRHNFPWDQDPSALKWKIRKVPRAT